MHVTISVYIYLLLQNLYFYKNKQNIIKQSFNAFPPVPILSAFLVSFDPFWFHNFVMRNCIPKSSSNAVKYVTPYN